MMDSLILALFEGQIFKDVNVFLMLTIIVAGLIGLLSRKGSIIAFSMWLVFAEIGSEAGIDLYTNTLYAVAGVLTIVMSFQVYGYVKGQNQEGM